MDIGIMFCHTFEKYTYFHIYTSHMASTKELHRVFFFVDWIIIL